MNKIDEQDTAEVAAAPTKNIKDMGADKSLPFPEKQLNDLAVWALSSERNIVLCIAVDRDGDKSSVSVRGDEQDIAAAILFAMDRFPNLRNPFSQAVHIDYMNLDKKLHQKLEEEATEEEKGYEEYDLGAELRRAYTEAHRE